MIKVQGNEITVDVLEELNPFEWNRPKYRENELTACSPFRKEHSPSFSINLTTGQWIDFGANDDIYNKGNLILLLSYLRNETIQEVEEYLLSKYALDMLNIDDFTLTVNLTDTEKIPRVFSLEEYKQYAYANPYLEKRGISEKVQRAFKVGYDPKSKAVALAWTDYKGQIVNIKFRSTKSKQFYYAEGQPIRNHLYGINFIFKLQLKEVFIVESEIDCMYLWTIGKPAIALGGSNLSKSQKQLILRSPINKLIIATDNDSAGAKIKQAIIKELNGHVTLCEIHLPFNVKDVNELPPSKLAEVTESYTEIGLINPIKL